MSLTCPPASIISYIHTYAPRPAFRCPRNRRPEAGRALYRLPDADADADAEPERAYTPSRVSPFVFVFVFFLIFFLFGFSVSRKLQRPGLHLCRQRGRRVRAVCGIPTLLTNLPACLPANAPSYRPADRPGCRARLIPSPVYRAPPRKHVGRLFGGDVYSAGLVVTTWIGVGWEGMQIRKWQKRPPVPVGYAGSNTWR